MIVNAFCVISLPVTWILFLLPCFIYFVNPEMVNFKVTYNIYLPVRYYLHFVQLFFLDLFACGFCPYSLTNI